MGWPHHSGRHHFVTSITLWNVRPQTLQGKWSGSTADCSPQLAELPLRKPDRTEHGWKTRRSNGLQSQQNQRNWWPTRSNIPTYTNIDLCTLWRLTINITLGGGAARVQYHGISVIPQTQKDSTKNNCGRAPAGSAHFLCWPRLLFESPNSCWEMGQQTCRKSLGKRTPQLLQAAWKIHTFKALVEQIAEVERSQAFWECHTC